MSAIRDVDVIFCSRPQFVGTLLDFPLREKLAVENDFPGRSLFQRIFPHAPRSMGRLPGLDHYQSRSWLIVPKPTADFVNTEGEPPVGGTRRDFEAFERATGQRGNENGSR